MLLHNFHASNKCVLSCAFLCGPVFLFLTFRSRLLLSFRTALILCLLLVSAPQSYSQWDSNDLPLCEAYRRRDSWASRDSSGSSTQEDREDVGGTPSQETNPQHHLNGHGTSTEKPWELKGHTGLPLEKFVSISPFTKTFVTKLIHLEAKTKSKNREYLH